MPSSKAWPFTRAVPVPFTWGVAWFSETLASPAAAGRTWQPDDLLTIPEPAPGTATKLFAAVERQAMDMLDQYADHRQRSP